MLLSEKKQIIYVINRLLELSENLEGCSRVNFKTRVRIDYNEGVRHNIYSIMFSRSLFNINCLVRRPNNYHDMLTKLYKELVENPEYIGVEKEDIEQNLQVFAKTLKGLKKKRERLQFSCSPSSVESVINKMPNWVVRDLIGSVLPKFSEHLKDKHEGLTHKFKNLNFILDNLDATEKCLLLESVASEELDLRPSCLVVKVPIEESEPNE